MKAKQKSFIGILAGLMIISAAAYGQTDRITGVVYDEDLIPLIGVNVTLVEAGLGSITDIEGRYTIAGITDPYCDRILTVAVSVTGYSGSTVNYYETCDGGSQTVNFFLSTVALVVSNIDDSGPGSLRQAILDANADADLSYINFNIDGGGPHTIQPLTPLPSITEALDINGYSEAGAEMAYNNREATLMIELDGSILSGDGFASGLRIETDQCVIRGLAINRFGDAGIHIQDPLGSNTIAGNYIGTDITGTIGFGNIDDGIRIINSPDNLIGGNTAAARNVISGNGDMGIEIQGPGASANRIEGNRVGSEALGNDDHGIFISAPGNTIGGASEAERNVISGNGGSGVSLSTSEAVNNLVANNYIGTGISGWSAVSNSGNGVIIDQGASNNRIGTGNVISGNSQAGVVIAGNLTTGNEVFESYIGLSENHDYRVRLPNGSSGIELREGASGSQIGPQNIISGNEGFGIVINDSNPGGNRVFDNYIGTDEDAVALLVNGDDGVNIYNSSGNIIEGNTLCGAGRGGGYLGNNGVEILGPDAFDNTVRNNFIGTNYNSATGLGNGFQGVQIKRNAHDNTIGPGNVICGNSGHGIYIDSEDGDSCNNNLILDNYIGTDTNGSTGLGNGVHGIDIRGNASSTTIGPGNTIVSNTYDGIHIENSGASGTIIVSNLIGTNNSNSTELGNGSMGIVLNDNVSNTSIGPGNVVSGNGMAGIQVHEGSSHNRIIGNLVGTTTNGMSTMGNVDHGIHINSPNNVIGGLNTEDRNVVAGNGYFGIELGFEGNSKCEVFGNYLGTDITGNGSMPNSAGDLLINSSSYNTIGGIDLGAGNVIGSINVTNAGAFKNEIIGNYIGTRADGTGALDYQIDRAGILVSDGSDNTIGPGNTISGLSIGVYITEQFGISQDTTAKNSIIGNLIGTNPDGSVAIANRTGILIHDAVETTIGGTSEADRNIISGSEEYGINLSGEANRTIIQGNFIGTDITGELSRPNELGILMELGAQGNYIGAGINGPGNLIAYNTTDGIRLDSDNNYVLGNVIRGNGEYGIIVNGSQNTIGGPTDADRNYMYDDYFAGLRVNSYGHHNLIEGNFFGTDYEGRLDQTDGGTGLFIFGSDNIIKNNLVSGYSGSGIHIMRSDPASDASRNWLEGNIIGPNASRDGFIPNRHGIMIDSAADNTVLRNVIAGNSENGIVVFENNYDNRAVNNRISQNSIFNNGGLGIELLVGDWGVTENDVDPLDPDTGPNNLQNFPSLDSISFGEGNVSVTGSLRTKSDSTYIIEFFSSNVGDETGYGEGEFYLGCDTVVTDDLGNAIFETTLPIQGYGAQVITATATDLDGNTSEFSQVIGGMVNQVLGMPFSYTMNSEGLSTVSFADYQNAIRNSFQTWDNIPTAEIEMLEAGTSDEKYASATDGLNLISFQDDRFPFPKGVLAVTAKTLRMTSGGTVAEILDADIVFNPDYIHDPVHSFAILAEGDTETQAFDIQSVATHEIGHVLGMIHSGVYSSTMFFMLGYGTTERELDGDDMAWASYRYPGEDFQANHGLISGNITYGDIGDVEGPVPHPPVAGALVLAVNTDTEDQKMFHAYTDADGNYTVPIYMDGIATDEYWIYIQPLDGDVYGTALKPANISPYIYSHTMFTDFPEEFYDDEESADDIPRTGDPLITVTAGNDVTGINLITNRDLTAPTVIGTSLDEESVNVAVSPTVAIKFSEPVDIYSFDETTCYMETGGDAIGGIYTLLADSTHIVLFKPVESLQYSSNYTLHVDGITDLKDNTLSPSYSSSFSTRAPDTEAPVVYDVIPAHELSQVDVTKAIKVFFSEAMNKSSVESGFILMTSDSTLVSGEYDWDLSNKEITYTPDYSLLEGTSYLISLTTQIMDLSDNQMVEDTTFTFSTVAVAEPQILYLGPADGSTGITVETPVVVKMSEPLDLTTITSTSFFLTDAGTAAKVNGSFEYLDDNRTLVFRPDQALKFNQLYSITLTSDISDMSNPRQYLQNTASSFTTSPDIVVPHITYMEPPFGARGAQTTIVGNGFDPVLLNNLVSFNGETATVTKASLESISVTVPNLAFDGPVTLSVNGIAADNSFEFDVVPPNTDPSYNLIASSTTGSRTRAVVINPDAGYAYVTNWGDNTVTPIDISDYIPVPEDDIPVGIEPMDIDLNPTGTLAYVTNYLSNTVSVIGTEEGASGFHEVTKNIPVGYHPYGVAASSDKKVYVANNESEYVSVIDVDPTSGGFDHVIANLKTGSKNRSIVVTPDAGLILVCGDDGVTIIDRDPTSPTFNDVVAVASKGSSTRNITITPDAALALATTEEGVILIIDIFQPAGPEFGNVIASVTTGSRARNITISPDAMYVYITNPDDNTVSVYQLDYSIVPGYGASLNNALGLVHITTIAVGDKPYAIAGHPNSEYILVTHDSETGGVSKIGVEEESVDVIYTLGQLIASVMNAIDDDVLAEKFGSKLLVDLNKTLDRINSSQLESAIDHLDNFITRVQRWIMRGEIPETLGNAWLEAAYRIRDQLVLDLNDLKKATEFTSDLQVENTLRLENRPNPFSHYTLIDFEIPDAGQEEMPVIMRVFNINGQVVKTLVQMDMAPGQYTVHWDSHMEGGGLAPDGIYLLELMVPTQRTVIRLSVVK